MSLKKYQKFMNKSIDEIMSAYKKSVGLKSYRILSLIMIADYEFYKKAGVDYMAKVRQRNGSDWLMAINQDRKLNDYVACCKLIAAQTYHGKFKIPDHIDREQMEQELNQLWLEIDFRIRQSCGECQYKYFTLLKVILGKFFKETGLSVQADVNANRKDFLTEVYTQGHLEQFKDVANTVLDPYDN